MIDIIYGFIIAIFVILSGCYIRLGLILQNLENRHDDNDQNNGHV